MKKVNEQGLSLVEGLLILIIVLLVAFISYYIWHSNQQSNKLLDTGTSVSSATTVGSFASCEKAKGSVTQQSYPEICVTKEGKSYTQPTPTSADSKAPADSSAPSASSCDAQTGANVTITLAESVPLPRCVTVTASQTLKLVNPTSKSTTATLGDKTVSIPAGESATISDEFGQYLQPGVHIVHTPVYGGGSGPEIWLQ